jgi:polar amino acid transport system substrate-binding protein
MMGPPRRRVFRRGRRIAAAVGVAATAVIVGTIATGASATRAAGTPSVIVVAADPTYPPVTYADSKTKRLTGVLPELERVIMPKTGIKWKLVPASFDSLIPGIQSGKYTTTAINDTPDREKVLDFVDFVADGTSLIVKAGNPDNLTIHTLCGKNVAVQKASEQAVTIVPQLSAACKKKGGASLHSLVYTSQNDAMLALASGRADGVLTEQIAAEYAASHSKNQFEIPKTDATVSRHQIGLAISKDQKALIPILTKAIRASMADGSYARVLRQWHFSSIAIDAPVVNVFGAKR